MPFAKEAIERMNRNLAQGLLNIQYLIDQMSLA